MKKVFQAALLSSCIALSFSSCSKKEEKTTPTPTPSSPSAPVERYYFEFNVDGKAIRLANQQGIYPLAGSDVGGSQRPSSAVSFPVISLTFEFPSQATDADVKALAGKRLKFGLPWGESKGLRAALEYQESASGETFYDNFDTTGVYYVEVSKVTYLKRDNVIGIPVDTYEMSGTCKAKLVDYLENTKDLNSGNFNIIVCRPLTDDELK